MVSVCTGQLGEEGLVSTCGNQNYKPNTTFMIVTIVLIEMLQVWAALPSAETIASVMHVSPVSAVGRASDF